MSYCRWSSDFWQCDVYVYESSTGWVTHVAGRRMKHQPPPELRAMEERDTTGADHLAVWLATEAWRESLPSDDVPVDYVDDTAPGGTRPGTMKFLKDSEYLDLSAIGPEAGETFIDPTPAACADRLEALRAKGFNVPQYAIDSLREEAADDAATISDEPR